MLAVNSDVDTGSVENSYGIHNAHTYNSVSASLCALTCVFALVAAAVFVGDERSGELSAIALWCAC
jgi:hypothetical protein